jgi:anti-anti-sigma factor
VIIAPPLGSVSSSADAGRRDRRLRVFPLDVSAQLVLVVTGEADISNSEELRELLIQASAIGRSEIVVDLVDLDFCDLSGLDALRAAAEVAAAGGVEMTFRGVSAQLRWLDGTFPVSMPVQRRTG